MKWTAIEHAAHDTNAATWAGEYRREEYWDFEGRSETILVAPDDGYARMTVYGAHTKVGMSTGDVHARGEVLALAHCVTGKSCTQKQYYAASRGSCKYLIEENQYDKFADASKFPFDRWDASFFKQTGSPARCDKGEWRLPPREVAVEPVAVKPPPAWHRWWRNWTAPDSQFIDETFLARIPVPRGAMSPAMMWRVRKLARELQQPGLPGWAGVYYEDSGRDAVDWKEVLREFGQVRPSNGQVPSMSHSNLDFVVLAPDSGLFAHRDRTGGGDISLEEYYSARVRVIGSRLRLERVERPPGRSGGELPFFSPSEYLYPVQLGKRHYLFEESEMPALVNALNSDSCHRECARGTFDGALMMADYGASFDGPAVLPEPYAGLVRRTPLVAKVTRLAFSLDSEPLSFGPLLPSYGSALHQTMTIDKGSRDGVFKGMALYVQPPCHDKTCYPPRGFVTAVQEDSADLDVVVHIFTVQLKGQSRAQELRNRPGVGASVSSIDPKPAKS